MTKSTRLRRDFWAYVALNTHMTQHSTRTASTLNSLYLRFCVLACASAAVCDLSVDGGGGGGALTSRCGSGWTQRALMESVSMRSAFISRQRRSNFSCRWRPNNNTTASSCVKYKNAKHSPDHMADHISSRKSGIVWT